MTICAGVQNVSRPMVECHEMSHSSPMGRQATAPTAIHPCHGSARGAGDLEEWSGVDKTGAVATNQSMTERCPEATRERFAPATGIDRRENLASFGARALLCPSPLSNRDGFARQRLSPIRS